MSVTLDLPKHKEYSKELENLGIEWTSSVQAKLPNGWKVSKRYDKELTLIDESGTPRVTIWVADKAFDQYVRVCFLRPGKEKLEREIHLIRSEYDERVHQFKKEYDLVWNIMKNLSPDDSLKPKQFLPRHIVYNGGEDIGG